MVPLNRPLSIRAGVLIQLVLVAAASLALVAVFALKAVGVALERRHAEAGVSVAEVVRRAVQNDFASGKFSPAASRPVFAGYLTPYIRDITLLPEGPPDGRPEIVPVGEKTFALLSISPTVDVTLPFALPEPVPGGPPEERVRGMRVRIHSSGIAEEVRTLVNVTMVLAALDVGVLVLFGGFLLERSVIAPVRRLAATSEKIAAGEYDLRAEGVEGNEIGQLAASFNKMVDGILEAKERSRRSELEAFRSDKLATVGRLAAGVAHEVGSPLMAIRGYAEHLLRHRPGPEETDECLGKVVEETRKMEQIVRGLLSVASPAGGREGATDVNAVIRRTVEMLSYRNLFRDVEVCMELDEVPGAAILEDRFRQVLLNLAINAVDAMSGKGRMTVRTWIQDGWNPGRGQVLRRRSGDPPEMDGIPLRAAGARGGSGVALSVTDTGSGIRPEDLPLVFDPFFTTKDPGKGTGLGLSVSRTIVESAGGEIRVESVEGGGATFIVVLPPARREAAAREEGERNG